MNEKIIVEFPARFKRLNLVFGRVDIEAVIKQQGNKVVLISDDSNHNDGEYYLAVVRAGDRVNYYAALLGNSDFIIEERFSYNGLVGLMVAESETLFTKEFEIKRYR